MNQRRHTPRCADDRSGIAQGRASEASPLTGTRVSEFRFLLDAMSKRNVGRRRLI